VSTTAQIVGIVSVLLSLFLVVRGFQSHGLSLSTTVKMAVAWIVIIVLGVLIVRQLAG
jgi:hypothetical protein